MSGLKTKHRRFAPPRKRSNERKKRRKPIKPDRKVSPLHPEVVFEFFGTRIADMGSKMFKKPKIVVHRPHEDGALYNYRRLDGGPVTDADLDACWKCPHCNPKPGPTIDNRKTF